MVSTGIAELLDGSSDERKKTYKHIIIALIIDSGSFESCYFAYFAEFSFCLALIWLEQPSYLRKITENFRRNLGRRNGHLWPKSTGLDVEELKGQYSR